MNTLYETEKIKRIVYDMTMRLYDLGWCRTGGGLSVKGYNFAQKEAFMYRMPHEMAIKHTSFDDAQFFLAAEQGPNGQFEKNVCAGTFFPECLGQISSLVHTHSTNAVSVGKTQDEFIEFQNDIDLTGIFNRSSNQLNSFESSVKIPIIDHADDGLESDIELAMSEHKTCSSVIVRGHGLFVFGKEWFDAKRECECFEQLFKKRLRQI